MTEEEFIEMAESYGLRADDPQPYGYFNDKYRVDLTLAGEYIGKITDLTVIGHPEESGRIFYVEPRPFQLPTEANSALLSQMTKERFEAMLTGRFDSIDLATRIGNLTQYLADVRSLNDKLGWGEEP